MSKRFAGITALAGAFLLTACGNQGNQQTAQPTAPVATATATTSAVTPQDSRLQILVFHADWCANCRFMAPIYSQYAGAHGNVRLSAVDVTDIAGSAQLLRDNGVSGVPAVIVMRDGVVLARKEGVQTPQGFANMVESAGRRAPIADIAPRLSTETPTSAAAPGSRSTLNR